MARKSELKTVLTILHSKPHGRLSFAQRAGAGLGHARQRPGARPPLFDVDQHLVAVEPAPGRCAARVDARRRSGARLSAGRSASRAKGR